VKRDARGNEATPGENTSAVHLWLVLWRATRALEAHAYRSVASQPIGPSDFAVLEVVLHKGPLPVNAIGRKVLLTSGSITVAVDRLETQGLVERRAHPTDRRARVVHLTREGKRLITGVFAEHERDMERAASALTASERAALVRLLKKLGLDAERTLGEASGTRRQTTKRRRRKQS
jgi:MarR family transcriptional regulator, 2-MHQ and catechol-resistance regulon repressor